MQPRGFFGDLESIIKQPKDKLILLKDILEDEVDEKYFLSEKMINGFSERNINHNEKGNGFKFNPTIGYKKGNAITNPGKNRADDNYIFYKEKKINLQKRSADRPSIKKNKNAGGSGHLSREDGKTYCLDMGNTQAVEITSGTLRTHKDGEGFREVKSGKGATIPARAREDGSGQNIVSINSQIRRLTPIECERLQTVKDGYTNHVSDSQRYKMLGNGWTVDVIAYIFSYIDK
jgi:DNA (cytosine-5)-methyltransferase 3A